jgi:hypothetical protein
MSIVDFAGNLRFFRQYKTLHSRSSNMQKLHFRISTSGRKLESR